MTAKKNVPQSEPLQEVDAMRRILEVLDTLDSHDGKVRIIQFLKAHYKGADGWSPGQ